LENLGNVIKLVEEFEKKIRIKELGKVLLKRKQKLFNLEAEKFRKS